VRDRDPLFGTDWYPRLRQEFTKPYWAELQAVIERECSPVYPPHDEVFKAFELTRYAQTKVVILGQDPYHGVDQAHGVAFSVRCGVPVPPSLKNIHKELHEDRQVQIPDHGNLETWARHGVLLLNATLTVCAGLPRSHRGKGWETFTRRGHPGRQREDRSRRVHPLGRRGSKEVGAHRHVAACHDLFGAPIAPIRPQGLLRE